MQLWATFLDFKKAGIALNNGNELETFELAHEIMVLITQAISEGSGELALPRSLARAFPVRTYEVWK